MQKRNKAVNYNNNIYRKDKQKKTAKHPTNEAANRIHKSV